MVIKVKNVRSKLRKVSQEDVAYMIHKALEKEGISVDTEVGRQGMYGWIEGSPSKKKKD